MRKQLLILTLFLLAVVLGCKKEIKQKEFPTDTTEGKNVFGCYIDNKMLLPCRPWGISEYNLSILKTNSWQYDLTHFGISISANNSCDKSYTYGRYVIISFDSVQISTNATYKLGSFYGTTRNKVSCLYSEDLQGYSSDSSLNGSLIVTYFDKDKRILSGKLEATLKDINNTKTVQLKEGKFDVKF